MLFKLILDKLQSLLWFLSLTAALLLTLKNGATAEQIASDTSDPASSFQTVLSRNDDICSVFGETISGELPEYSEESFSKHPMFKILNKIDVRRRKIKDSIPNDWHKILSDHVYTAEIDLDGDGTKERLFRAERLRGRAITSYYYAEIFSIYSEPYPRMAGETILPDSPWFFALPGPEYKSPDWEVLLDFTDFPRNLKKNQIRGDRLNENWRLISDYITLDKTVPFPFFGKNFRTVIFTFQEHNYLAPFEVSHTENQKIANGLVLEYQNKGVKPICVTVFK